MAYARVGIWKVRSEADRNDLADMLRNVLVPAFRGQGGFISYMVVGTGDNVAVGLQTWDSQEQAARAGAQTGDQLRERVGDRAVLESWFHGEVVVAIPPAPHRKPTYAQVDIWDIAPNADRSGLIEKAREALIPMYQDQAGMVDFTVIDTVEGRLVAAHSWENEEDSTRGMQGTGEWLRETLADQLALIARYDGNVMLREAAETNGGGSGS